MVRSARRDLSARPKRRGSTVEGEPADRVAQALIVEDELSDLRWEPGPLPPALRAADRVALVVGRCRSHRPDRIGRGTQLMGCDMAHRGRLSGSVRGKPGRPTQVSGRGIGMAGRCPRLRPRDLTPRPRSRQGNRPSWTVVLGAHRLEVIEDVLRTVGRPERE